MALEQVSFGPSHPGVGLSGLQFSEGTLAGRDSGLPEVVSPARDTPCTASTNEAGAQRMPGNLTALSMVAGYRSETPSNSAPVEPAAGPSPLGLPEKQGQANSEVQMPESNPEAGPAPDQEQSNPGPAAPGTVGTTAAEGSGPVLQQQTSPANPSSAVKPSISKKAAAAAQASPTVPKELQNYDFLGKLSAGLPKPDSQQLLLTLTTILDALPCTPIGAAHE